ncbi:MAG: hypothetical protein GPJ51_03045 [Candidatus Heimdallarchaeota archaeon]|nr:hypothetical protein [Candidatus Heimdallarchaeota archaeon]
MAKQKVKAHERPRKGDRVGDYERTAKTKTSRTKEKGKTTYKKYGDSERVNKAESKAEKVPVGQVQVGVAVKKETDKKVDQV